MKTSKNVHPKHFAASYGIIVFFIMLYVEHFEKKPFISDGKLLNSAYPMLHVAGYG